MEGNHQALPKGSAMTDLPKILARIEKDKSNLYLPEAVALPVTIEYEVEE